MPVLTLYFGPKPVVLTSKTRFCTPKMVYFLAVLSPLEAVFEAVVRVKKPVFEPFYTVSYT